VPAAPALNRPASLRAGCRPLPASYAALRRVRPGAAALASLRPGLGGCEASAWATLA